MKFVEKKNKEKEIECGDYVLINGCTLGIVAECGREYSILFLENGYFFGEINLSFKRLKFIFTNSLHVSTAIRSNKGVNP